MSAKASTQSPRLASVQPWIRDHYAALRDGATPRFNQTRAVIVPVVVDVTHRVRDEFLPAAAQLSSRVGTEAVNRSAPMRAEAMHRTHAVLAAARGQVSEDQLARLQKQNGRRKLWFMLSATATGAAAAVALVLWQRSRGQEWVDDDAVHSTLEGDHEPMRDARGMNGDDPSNADGGVSSDQSESESQSRAEHHAHH